MKVSYRETFVKRSSHNVTGQFFLEEKVLFAFNKSVVGILKAAVFFLKAAFIKRFFDITNGVDCSYLAVIESDCEWIMLKQ